VELIIQIFKQVEVEVLLLQVHKQLLVEEDQVEQEQI
jgi:hypothetical protein